MGFDISSCIDGGLAIPTSLGMDLCRDFVEKSAESREGGG